MRTYVTLFDKNYLLRGLSMIISLRAESSKPFWIHVLALDDTTARVLRGLNQTSPFLKVWTMEDLWTDELRKVRENRSYMEWCWTLGSVFSNFMLKNGCDEVTYLDSDLYFFGDPEKVFEEIGERSIAIVPHRLIPEKQYLIANGVYNVGWVTFRGDLGKMACERWANQCKEWCYNRQEPDRFGDQKYLDKWPETYGCKLKVIQNIGVGLAPWNLAQYQLEEIKGKIYVDGIEVIFYHFHEFCENADGSFRLTNYHLRPNDIAMVYNPYLQVYKRLKEEFLKLTHGMN